MNRRNILQILKHYGIGDTTLDILREYWRKQRCIIKSGSYYSKQFKPTSGVTQGDILSPTFFNIIVDSILKRLYYEMNYNPYLKIKTASLFYADDGEIIGEYPMEIQELLNRMMGHFQMYDLFPNTSKTKNMIPEPPLYNNGCSINEYNQRNKGTNRLGYERVSKSR